MTGGRGIATLLAALAGVLAVAAAACWALQGDVVDADGFADQAVSALHRDAVRRAVSAEIYDQVRPNVPAAAASDAQLHGVVNRTVRGAAFERVFRDGAVTLNGALFHGDGSDTRLLVNLAAVLRPTSPQLAAVVGDRDVTVLSLRGARFVDRTTDAARLVSTLRLVLPLFALAAFIAALLLAPGAGRVLVATGLAAAIAGALLLIALVLGRSTVTDAIELAGASARDAARAIWDVYAGGLRTTAFVAIVAGLVLAGLGLAVSRR